jgi:hypothetical protein
MTEKEEYEAIKKLGDKIGYGNLMRQASNIWRDLVRGGEFVVGPCKTGTVNCVCKDYQLPGHCDWCNGSGWLTEAVRELVDKQRK